MWSAKPSGGDRDRWNTVRVVSTGPRTSEPICESTCGNGVPSGPPPSHPWVRDGAVRVTGPSIEYTIPAKKMGRPKSDKPKPWDGTGLSKSEYYRKKSKGEV
jgi:hypothetical protein